MGMAKRPPCPSLKTRTEAGKGLKTINVDKKNGPIVGFKIVAADEELVILTSEGHIIRLETGDVSTQKRYSRGVVLMKTSKQDHVAAVGEI